MKREIALSFLLLTLTASANDGVYYTSGNQLVPLQETTIRVDKEVLTISLTDEGYASVDVYYEFFNPENKDKVLLMGFEADPSYNDDYLFHADGIHPHILDFSVEVNGQRMEYKNAVSQTIETGEFAPLDTSQWVIEDEPEVWIHRKGNEEESIRYAYVYYFNATFHPGMNKVHHTYRYTESMSVSQIFEIPYKLTPASRWAGGQIADFTLIVEALHTAKHFLIQKKPFGNHPFEITQGTGKVRESKDYVSACWEFSLRNGRIEWHQQDFTPKDELFIQSADINYLSEKLGSFYDRGRYHSFVPLEKTQDMLRIARNLPYAHRGRIFKDKKLQRYFDSLWWYMPDPTYRDDTSDFTKVDWMFIQGKLHNWSE